MIDLHARTGLRSQLNETIRVCQASRAGVPSADPRMQGARLHDVVTVKDGQAARTTGTVAFENAGGVNQQRPCAGRLWRQGPHGIRDRLHGNQLGIGEGTMSRDGQGSLACLPASRLSARTGGVRAATTAPTA
ncbi:hypothetical protein [Candidatus Frankia nodulisporulans]|uniref:hypothetical protein n=1 Tax=Candidatus Frankia nodulisporulans TaxID=2060052 RepID=UPI0013D47430|nr:hypothetical protein [Candidatus Frankia nodulisporulans]